MYVKYIFFLGLNENSNLLVLMVMMLEIEFFVQVIQQIYNQHSIRQWHKNNDEHQVIVQVHDNIE